MQWIDGVTWNANGYCVVERNHQNEVRILPIEELPHVYGEAACRPSKLRGKTDFGTWRRLAPSEVAEVRDCLGFPRGATGQDFFEFSCCGESYVLPAGVLMCAMFRPFRGLSRYLVAPQGLENLFVPSGNVARPQLQFFVGARTTTGLQTKHAEGVLNSFSWMYCFPSASQMWSSVLCNARSGRLTLDLPIGSFQFYGRGIPLGGRTLITDLKLTLLETIEEPLPHFSNHTRQIEFERMLHNPGSTRGSARVASQPLPSRAGVYALSDAEWSAAKEVLELPSTNPRQYAMRAVVNGILEKFGQGLSWQEASGLVKSAPLLPKTYSRMKADGRWNWLMAYLLRTRTAD